MKKNDVKSVFSGKCRFSTSVFAVLLGLLAGVSSDIGAVEITQVPLYAGSRVPGNVVLVPSVEFPTIDSQANLGDYNHNRRYSGYFDPNKCYLYEWAEDEDERHFAPTRVASRFDCPVKEEWSGNYLNWATTQTIDPFRSALTGGHRVKDDPDVTWLQKARHDRDDTNGSYFPDRRMPGSGNDHPLVRNITGASWGSVKIRVRGLGNRMWFTADFSSLANDASVVSYNPDIHKLNNEQSEWDTVYEVNVRVKVCDPSVGLETNCKEYDDGWKPEGLIQEYSDRIRYSIFGFLNHHGTSRNGGVLRARQKFVGPQTHYPEAGPSDNTRKEWNPETGVLEPNPDFADAAATGLGVEDSGVINYLNKFGQMTGQAPKDIDPVSELFYAMLRYFRGQGNVSEYSNDLTYERTDGFPVISDWEDPIRYACQVNAALGIGDVYTHVDHDIPGDDLELAQKYTQKIFDLEEIDKNAEDEFTGRSNSAYIAGLAYYANTTDLRPDSSGHPNSVGRQTLSTYWVDVRESQTLEPKRNNQYWLAAKYGGFNVPSSFDPLATDGLDQSWWHRSGEYLRSGANGDVTTTVTGYPRPDNFYVASEADKMVASLRLAFQNIVDEVVGSGGGFASNSTVLEAGAKTFQARFRVDGGSWSGDLQAYDVDLGSGALTPSWSAAGELPDWTDRNIFVNNGGWKEFTPANMSGKLDGNQVEYLRGDPSNEQPGGSFRRRTSVLGDIVNSEPVYVGAPNRTLFLGATFNGADQYQAFAAAQQGRREMVYVGANDGMLHGFDANLGEEVFAFIPSAAIDAGLGDLTDPDYEHRYFVDGELTVADVFNGVSWRTLLVGTMGRGGRGMFALDVTDPDNVSFLWERTASDITALGNNLGKPIIAQTGNGQWEVFLGNGPNGSGGTAQLIRLNVFTGTGSVINTSTGTDNGLSGVNIWSSTTGGFSDTAYAGDLEGNFWKFDLVTGSATVLFHTGAQQPITATPLVARRPGTTETWLFFGTGRYLNAGDLTNKAVQTWYGIVDRGSQIPSNRSTLRGVDIIAEGLVGPDGNQVAARGVEHFGGGVTGDGWYMDLVSPVGGEQGERMVVPNQFRGSALIGTSRIPDADDPCSPSGTGFIMAIDPFTGGRLAGGSFFDADGDGSFDDTVGEPPVPVSGIGMPSGPNNPVFIDDSMYVSLDDASSKTVETNPAGMAPRRVSWRELLGN